MNGQSTANVYFDELQNQCHYALRSYDELQGINQRQQAALSGDERADLNRDTFRTLHSFLTHAANVSKLLWPPKREVALHRDRAEFLRSELGIAGSHPLDWTSRKLRNYLDHYDEWLDKWMDESKDGGLVVDLIGPLDSVDGVGATGSMRQYDPNTNMMGFRGEKYDIQALREAILEMYKDSVKLLRGKFKR